MASNIDTQLSAAIDKNWARQVEWLKSLVSFPSLRGEEAPCQDWIAREFANRGWAVDRYTLADVPMETLPGFSPVMDTDYSRAVQVVASLRAPKPAGRSLIMQGHVDVVPTGPVSMWQTPPFVPTIKDGRVHGRGANDMKSGVCAMVFALDALRDAGYLPGSDVYVQTVTEEEFDRQRRAFHIGARLSRRRLPHPRADRCACLSRHDRRDVVPAQD